ncbi:hypothetical protein Dimus_033959 [Dionaea muscipula]
MAAEEEFDDGCEFLLPSHFLTDDDIILDFAGDDGKCGGIDGLSLNFSGFDSSSSLSSSSSGSVGVSDLGSPVDSVSGSWMTEMESSSCTSDEEIYNIAAGLTRRLARSSIDDYVKPNSKGWGLSRSPQSTLSGGVFGGCDCRQMSSSSGSPCSPMTGKGRDLLREVASSMRSRREEGTGFFDSSRALRLNRSPRNPKSFPSSPFEKEKQQLVNQGGVWGQAKSDGQGRNRSVVGRKIDAGRPTPLSSPSSGSGWPPPHSPGSGMRAMFLDSPGSKRERAGTGVFLPKPTDSRCCRKQPSCSTVLIPAKVVQALNNMNMQSSLPSPSRDFDLVMRTGRNDEMRSQKDSPRANNVEVQLPQEWTY